MSLPSVIPFPSTDVRRSLTDAQLDGYVDSIDLVLKAYIEKGTTTAKVLESADLKAFIRTFYHELGAAAPSDPVLIKTSSVRTQVFSLVQLCLENHIHIETLSNITSLSDLAKVQTSSEQLTGFLHSSWTSNDQHFQKSAQVWRRSLTTCLESKHPETASKDLLHFAPLIAKCQDLAAFLLTGSDLLDAATSAYANSVDDGLRKGLTVVVYLGLKALISGDRSNASALTDHLFNLRTEADRSKTSLSLLADLITNTSLLKHIQQHNNKSPSDRLAKLATVLVKYEQVGQVRRPRRIKKHVDKGKGRQTVPVHEDHIHIHKMSLVTQIQDLFPDLGAGFIMRLLDEYDDNTETVISHLLEDSLPASFKDLDRHESAPVFSSEKHEVVDHLIPQSAPPLQQFVPSRANAFDNDEFDRLEVDASRLHIGKKEDDTAEVVPANKAAIMAALAAFDADDDERDDTYDAEDVGGTVDHADHDGEDAVLFDDNDLKLYKLFEATPEVFGRTAEIRRSQQRASLKQQVGMTDEAIEGWAIMLQRDSRRARKLGLEASRFDGRQAEVARTAYRAADDDGETNMDSSNSRGGFRGRGRGGFRGRGRGNVAGPSNDSDNAAAKRRKEANKSSRANHSRRDQRARKMARGGFPAAS